MLNFNNFFKISNNKRVLYLKSDFSDQLLSYGGAYSHTMGVVKAFKKKNYFVVFASFSKIKGIEKFVDYNYTLKIFPFFFFLRWKIGFVRWHLDCLFSNVSFFFQVRRLIKQHAVDFIYQRYSWLNMTGLLISKVYSIPFVFEYNGSEVSIKRSGNEKKPLLEPLAKKIEVLNLVYADYIIVISDELKKILLSEGVDEKKILVNPNGVDTSVFDVSIKPPSPVHKKICSKKFIVGFVGSFSYWHGIDTLSKIIPAVVKKDPKVFFLLIGDGPMLNFLKRSLRESNITRDNVLFTGAIDHDRAQDYLSICDVFLCPTKQDNGVFFGSPTKLFEYMSLAKPVIASNIGQIKQIINPAFYIYKAANSYVLDVKNEVGFLVEPDDIQSFVQALFISIKSDETKRKKIGNNARKRIDLFYSWDKNIERFENFIVQQGEL